MVTKHDKSAARILDRDCINRRCLDLSKEVLWVSVCQRAIKLPAVKVGGLTKSSAVQRELKQTCADRVQVPDNFDHPQV